MFLCGKLLSLLGSKIEVESPWRSDGPGSAFYFRIDMALAPALAPASAPARAPGLKIETDHAGASLPPDTSPDSVTMAIDGVAPAQQPSAASKGHVEEPGKAPRVGSPPSGQASAPDEPSVFEPNLRVLVADDALMNRRLLRRAFTSYFGQGWSVTEATSAEEAVLLATETAFEVIVMDEIFAPGVDAMRGSAAITDVRAHEARASVARRAVIVSCTGNAASSLTNLDASGADLVWGKPMPNFTNGEMQNDLAPRLAESLARAHSFTKGAIE